MYPLIAWLVAADVVVFVCMCDCMYELGSTRERGRESNKLTSLGDAVQLRGRGMEREQTVIGVSPV